MNTKQMAEIQRALNWIREQADEADAKAKMEVLALLNGTSQSVIAMAKKLIAAKSSEQDKAAPSVKVNAWYPKPKIVKQGQPPQTATDTPATAFHVPSSTSPASALGPAAPSTTSLTS